MGISVDPHRLQLELARRCWSATDLAREAGISGPTVSAALSGRRISARSLALIARCIARIPAVSTVDQLLGEQHTSLEG
ncbi:MAG: helix-turn-helix domain-containing protein [Acidimicrobiales bacterium]